VVISGNAATNAGGGIRNVGELTLDRAIISGNSAGGGPAGKSGSGGGSDNDGDMIVSNSRFDNNLAVGGANADGSGGGINENGTVTLENSTVSGNSATPGTGTAGVGATASGALFGDSGGTTTLNHSTVTANIAGDGSLQPGCAIFNNQVSLELKNTIVSGNTASFDLFNVESDVVASGGFNLIGRTN